VAWDPGQYLAYDDLRLRPGLDLLARIPVDAPERVVDLGCGPGNLTLALADRWPRAEIAGVDDSEPMLEEAVARDTDRRVSWMPGDLRTWAAAHRVDVIFSNAALHWVGDHPRVLHHWLGQLTPGGVLAFQVPDNFDQPSHTSIAEVVDEGPWASRLRPLLLDHPVLPAHRYHRLLHPVVAHLDVWETTYWQVLTGPDPVLEWVRGSLLRPLLPELGDEERDEFLGRVAEKLRAAYPADESGVTLFPFQRLFVVAQRR
jgi:trans-aconitate 2-methyltransferase